MIEEFYKSTKGVNLARFAVDEARSMFKVVDSTIDLLLGLSGDLSAALELLSVNSIDSRIDLDSEEVLDHLSDLRGIAVFLDDYASDLEFKGMKGNLDHIL